MASLRLGLIGMGIGRSSAPRLHREAGRLAGVDLTYELMDLEHGRPQDIGRALERCVLEGFAAVNVTHPFKERASGLVRIEDPEVRRIGSVNTVRLDSPPGTGFNTDHSGFMKGFRRRFPRASPGVAAVVGAGGVGRPVSFALAALGARAIRIFDRDDARTWRLARDLAEAWPGVESVACERVEAAATGADGLVNCTPIGMFQYPGSPVPARCIDRQRWAFDAVYTPLETEFLAAARAAGLEILSGYELFFYQGVDAFEIFTGIRVDEAALRGALDAPVR
jgi:shikimate dehydrogenase